MTEYRICHFMKGLVLTQSICLPLYMGLRALASWPIEWAGLAVMPLAVFISVAYLRRAPIPR
jgi:hypothetical protein